MRPSAPADAIAFPSGLNATADRAVVLAGQQPLVGACALHGAKQRGSRFDRLIAAVGLQSDEQRLVGTTLQQCLRLARERPRERGAFLSSCTARLLGRVDGEADRRDQKHAQP